VVITLFPSSLPADQRLNLTKSNPDDEEMIRGQLILSLTSRDHNSLSANAVALTANSSDELPEG